MARSSSKLQAAPPSSDRTTSRESTSKFELIAELGRGGMATVYLARAKRRRDRLIVYKELRPDIAENEDFLAMFLEEARLAGKLRHPNIVETYEVGMDAGRHYYIAMEYLDGLSLQAILTKVGWKGSFTFALQVHVLIEALRALEHAFSQQDDDGTPLRIVHRDVSPPNIIVTFAGAVKLVDFGIAKAANSHVETRTGLIKGKLTYMAPEQAASGDVDSRTDTYSIGVLLWQAAAGTRRWKGVDNTEVLRRLHAGNVSDSPNAAKNGLPARVDEIVLKAIAAEPEDRWASPAKFRTALEDLLVDMHEEVTREDLARFMEAQFGELHRHAQQVVVERIQTLDGLLEPSPEPRKSSSKTKVASRRDVRESQTEAALPSVEFSETKISPKVSTRQKRGWLIVLCGAAAAAVLILGAIRNQRRAGIIASSIAPTATATATPTEDAVPPTSNASLPAAVNSSAAATSESTPSPTPPRSPKIRANPSPSSALPRAHPSAPPPPTTSAAPIVSDPQSSPSSAPASKDDPWAPMKSGTRPDPWAK